MKDLKITKKRSLGGSLARRIAIIAILLLVVPLLLQTLFLYNQEYLERIEEVEDDLSILAEDRAYFLGKIIEINWDLIKEKKALLAKESELLNNLSRFGVERIPLPQKVPHQFVVISQSKNAIVIGVADSNLTALVTFLPFSFLAKGIPKIYPIVIELSDEKGQVFFASQNLSFKDVLQARAPISKTGLFLDLKVEKSKIQALQRQAYYLRFVSLLFFVGVLGGGMLYLFVRRVARPFRHLGQVLTRVSQGAAHVRYQSDWMGFEINAIGEKLNEALEGLLYHEKEAQNQRIEREKLLQELQIGHEIQESLVPKKTFFSQNLDIGVCYLAAKEVNGDFYDLFEMPNQKILFVISDTAGKGIGACLFALTLRSSIRSIASVTDSLEEIVQKVNDLYLLDTRVSSMFSTLWLGIYDPNTHHLTYCSQGHLPALMVRGLQIKELWTQGIALGAQKIDAVITEEITLEKDDLLFLYTDGIVEAHDIDNHLFGKERLEQVIQSHLRETSQQISDNIREEVHLFARGAPQHDDMTFIVLRVLD